MWLGKYFFLNCIYVIGIQAVNKSDSRNNLNINSSTGTKTGYHTKRSTPATKNHRTKEYYSNYFALQNSLQMPTMRPSTGTLTMLPQKPNKGKHSMMPLEGKTRNINQYHFNMNSKKKYATKPMNTLMSEMYTYLFGTGKQNTTHTSIAVTDQAEPRVLLMTVGIVNGLIAAGAALSMTGVMITGLCVLVKMAIVGMVAMAGWIYVI